VTGNTLNQIPTIQGKINGLNEQLLLNPDGGNIIIGQTTNTGQKLQVNGKIKTIKCNIFGCFLLFHSLTLLLY
jgi:hypothetical protein